MVTTPITSREVAEADVVGGKQAISVRCGKAGCSAIVHSTVSSAAVADPSVTVRNNCGQSSTSGKTREVADGFTNVNDFCVGVGEPVFKFFDGGYLPRRNE